MTKFIMVSKLGCGPCEMIKPHFNKLKTDSISNDIEYIYLNVSESEDAMNFAISENIGSVPTFIVEKEDGNKLKFVGAGGFREAITYLNSQS